MKQRTGAIIGIGAVLCLLATFLFVRSRSGPDLEERSQDSDSLHLPSGNPGEAGSAESGGTTSKSGRRPKNPGRSLITTESGFQYKVLREGTGPRPGPSDKAKVHYRGTFEDGTEFDSFMEPGKPAALPVDGVIKGFAEGLRLMPVGSKYKFVIPPELGYGDEARGKIPANSTLVYEVELVGIE